MSYRISPKQLATIDAISLWVASIVLAFLIAPGSGLMFLSDALLLIGFYPLLSVLKPGWPLLVFGVLNVFIGSVLTMTQFLPEGSLTKEMILVRKHVIAYHPPLTWIIIGMISVFVGLVRTMAQFAFWLYAQVQKQPR